MKETWRLVRRVIEDGDVVLEVVDARDPGATRVEDVEKLADKLGKRLLIVLNKADLVERDVLEKWRSYFKSLGRAVVYISAKYRLGTRKLIVAIRSLAPRIPVTVVVVGYPNVGKSTIINYLKGRYVAPTSPKPGWTRGEQLVRAKSWLLVLDTPGVVKTMSTGDLALDVIKGLVDPGAIDDPVPYAYALLRRVLSYNPKALVEAYGIDCDLENALEEIGRVKKRLLKGGKVNIDEAARIVLKDWIVGKLRYSTMPP
ncbi:small GTP-binding protein [Pyrobaculum islandicum DSM 4184]|uniref:Small GTP-binding protein n=1 Tax=Pyrobaculum islandicum (strain DSM 4184 / JCM 9189 / GEO3) TaxID=384616 RepID=A1RTE0_PYRIL|nr:GTPase [Pyrobaculum islandicum]ABL88222.1 small GTP-binding protein [Pyrobaculum islandicum DSM 4184]